MRRGAFGGIWDMKHFLMFGSSHSACYKGITLPENMSLTICANRAGNLFRNLIFPSHGQFSIAENANEWDKKVFHSSIGDAPMQLSRYDYILINIEWRIDLPMLLHGDVGAETAQHSLMTMSDSLINEIISHARGSSIGAKNTLKLTDQLVKQGFNPQNIFCFLSPFSCAPESISTNENGEKIKSKASSILAILQGFIHGKYGVKLVLPDAEMMENGMFIKHLFAKPDKFTNWMNCLDNKLLPADRMHKNSEYANAMILKLQDLITG
jgi:hypothetical protein